MERTTYNLESSRVIKSFCVVGLNENKITKYYEEEIKYVSRMDIIKKNMRVNCDKLEFEKEKWLLLNKSTNHWMRIEYTKKYDSPITFMKVIECEYESPEYLLVSKNSIDAGFRPIIAVASQGNDEEVSINSEILFVEKYNDYYYKIPSSCNVKEAMNLNVKSPAAIFAITRVKDKVPLKDIKIVYDKIQGSKIGIVQNKSPYALKYMPEILDVYPTNIDMNPGIGMFCFPEGIDIKTNLDMPKWFSFILTDEIGRRTYASCLIFTEELTDNLVNAFQPQLLLKSNEKYYVEKALCVIGYHPFLINFKIFLRELYRIQVSNTEIPLERIICHFVDSIFFQNERALCYQIAEEELKFYKQPVYGTDWDTNDDALELLFITLSIDNIILLWEGLLLERKIFLVSKSKSLLSNICTALASLLFPFQWIHVMIPILPEKLKVFTDAPVPVLIGLCYKLDVTNFPADSIVLNIDNNSLEKYLDRLPKLPPKLNQQILKRMEKLKNKYKNPEDEPKVLFADEVFNYSGELVESKEKFKATEVRDIFYEFFVLMFKNFEKYFGLKGRKVGSDGRLPPPTFNRELFLKDHSSTEPGSFLYKFTETNIFAQFEDSFIMFEHEHNNVIQFFIDSIKMDKKKDKFYLPYIRPTLSSLVPQPEYKDLKNTKKFYYKYFPRLNPDLYNKIDAPRPEYISKFEIYKNEWCYDIPKKNYKDWIKFLLYNIYEIWYQLFSVIMPTFDDKRAASLVDHAIFLLNEMIKKKITPTRSLYPKLVRACGRKALSSKLNLIFPAMQSAKHNPTFFNAYMSGLYDAATTVDSFKSDGQGSNTFKSQSITRLSSAQLRSSILNLDVVNSLDIQKLLERKMFINYEYCPNCYKVKKNSSKKLTIEEVLGGFKKDKSCYYSICPVCLCKVYPKIYILYRGEKKNLENVDSVNLLSPIVLLKEVDNLIKNHGEKYFFSSDYFIHKDHRQIFWNLAYYFEILGLPTFVLYIEKDEDQLNQLTEKLEITRINSISKPQTKSSQNTLNNSRISGNNNLSDLTSRKQSSASNEIASVYSGTYRSANTNYFQIYSDYYKIIQSKILEKIEMFANNSDSEKMNEEKSDIMNNITELRSVLGKSIEEFNLSQKLKMESFFKELLIEETDNKSVIKIDNDKPDFQTTNSSSLNEININSRSSSLHMNSKK